MSYDTMEANQWRGKGFKMLHLYGDHLWELGSKGDPPLLLPQMQVAEAEATSGESRDQSLRESGDHLLPIPSSKKAEVEIDSSGGNMGKNLKVPFDVTCAADVNVTTGCTEATCCLTSDESSPSSLGQKLADTEIDDNVESMAIAEVVKSKPTPSGSQLSEDMKDDALSETVKKYCPEKLEDESDLDDQSNKDLCETTESTAPPMDDLLNECFYMAIKSSIKKDDLPVLTSTFYRSHMMPLCPPGLSLDIKKSTYKKLSKFLSAMQDEGVVKVKEVSKGVESIAEIDFKHIKVKGLVPKYVNSAMKTIGESTPASATSVASNTAGRAPQMIITELYIPSRKVFPIFSPYGYSTSTMMTHSMVREVVTRYIKERELTSTTNSRLVILDPILTDAILKKGEVLPTELPWQQIMSRILEEMRPGYSIQQGADKLYKRTKLEPVRLSITTRTGNKKATLVDNLDYYGISPADVVHQIQRIAAASATVNEVSGRPQRQQVMVQGSNVKVIAKLLEEQHGVPLKYIEAVDRTKLPKTQKRQGSKR